MMLTEGEAHNIVEANPGDGVEAWLKLHERWGRKLKMSSTAISERIKSVQKCQKLDDMLPRINDLENDI